MTNNSNEKRLSGEKRSRKSLGKFIERNGSLPFFIVGAALILVGTNHEVIAQSSAPYDGLVKSFKPLNAGVCAIYNFAEGSYGALLTTIAGIAAIAAAAFGKYSQAYNMMIVAVGCFILRSFISLFFGYYQCETDNFGGVKSFLDGEKPAEDPDRARIQDRNPFPVEVETTEGSENQPGSLNEIVGPPEMNDDIDATDGGPDTNNDIDPPGGGPDMNNDIDGSNGAPDTNDDGLATPGGAPDMN